MSTPLARNTDPDTSRKAASELTESGKHQAQKAEVYAALRSYAKAHIVGAEIPFYPTSAELAMFAGLDRYAVARRLPDLEKDELVEKVYLNGELIKRRCKATGKTATVWRRRPLTNG